MKTKFFLRLATVVVLVCFVTIISSCSGDDDDKGLDKSVLVGTWEGNGTSIVFKKDGTGYDINYFNDRDYFEWSANDMQIVCIYEGNVHDSGYHVPGPYTYYYTIVGKVLTLYYSDWDLRGSYVKK